MSNDPSWRGVGHGLLVLAAIWWVWTGYAWLTNSLEPSRPSSARACSPRWQRCSSSPSPSRAHSAARACSSLSPTSSCDSSTSRSTGSARGRPAPVPRAHALLDERGDRTPPHPRGRIRRWPVARGALGGHARCCLLGRPVRSRTTRHHRRPLRRALRAGRHHRARWFVSYGCGVGATHVSLTPGIVSAAILGILVIAAIWWSPSTSWPSEPSACCRGRAVRCRPSSRATCTATCTCR